MERAGAVVIRVARAGCRTELSRTRIHLDPARGTCSEVLSRPRRGVVDGSAGTLRGGRGAGCRDGRIHERRGAVRCAVLWHVHCWPDDPAQHLLALHQRAQAYSCLAARASNRALIGLGGHRDSYTDARQARSSRAQRVDTARAALILGDGDRPVAAGDQRFGTGISSPGSQRGRREPACQLCRLTRTEGERS